jgi:proline dehydrogenase
MDYLGESVRDPSESEAARDQILLLLDRLKQEDLDAYVSVKLSQLGVKLSEETAVSNLRMILDRARQLGLRIRIDMENSPLLEKTLRIYRQLRDVEGYDNVGVVIQAYLYRSEADVRRLAMEGAWVRLVKGAYLEPPSIAFPHKADTDANFVRLIQLMLDRDACALGAHTAVASHDAEMVQATIDFARANEIPNSCFEFQMLYGIRRELQESLLAKGYNVRVYVPYGTAWYPYFMRRLAERPANLWFFISNLIRG